MAKKKKEDSSDLPGASLKEKAQLLKNRINQEKKKTIIQTFTDEDDISVKRMSTGILKFDKILGGNKDTGYGWPIGRTVCVHGPESAGKTSVMLSSIAEAQKTGRLAVLVDGESSYEPSRALLMGINIDELLVINPETSEECFDALESLIKSGEVCFVGIDSLDSLTPSQILQASAEDQFMGVAARVNNRFFTKIQKSLMENECVLLVISQLREKIGVMYGNPEIVQGGRGIKFAASVRAEVRRDEEIKENGNPVGHTIKIKLVKSKVSKPMSQTYVRLDWEKGFNKAADILGLALDENIISKAGAGWMSFQSNKYGEIKLQGETNFVSRIESDEDLYKEILEKLGM